MFPPGQKLCFLLPNDIIQKGSVKFQYDPKSKHVTVRVYTVMIWRNVLTSKLTNCVITYACLLAYTSSRIYFLGTQVVSSGGSESSSPQMAFPVVPSGQKPPPPILLSGGRGGAPIPRLSQGGIPSNPLTAQQGNRQWNRLVNDFV